MCGYHEKCHENQIIKRNKVVRYKPMTDDTLGTNKKMESVRPHKKERLMKGMVDRKLLSFEQHSVAIEYSGIQTGQ